MPKLPIDCEVPRSSVMARERLAQLRKSKTYKAKVGRCRKLRSLLTAGHEELLKVLAKESGAAWQVPRDEPPGPHPVLKTSACDAEDLGGGTCGVHRLERKIPQREDPLQHWVAGDVLLVVQ